MMDAIATYVKERTAHTRDHFERGEYTLDINLASHHLCDRSADVCNYWEKDGQAEMWNGGNMPNDMPKRNYSQKNFGVGVTHLVEQWRNEEGKGNLSLKAGESAGVYHNSLRRWTFYASEEAQLDWNVPHTRTVVGVGVQAGLATGYLQPAVIMVQGYAHLDQSFEKPVLGVEGISLKAGVMPGVQSNALETETPSALTCQVGVMFGKHGTSR